MRETCVAMRVRQYKSWRLRRVTQYERSQMVAVQQAHGSRCSVEPPVTLGGCVKKYRPPQSPTREDTGRTLPCLSRAGADPRPGAVLTSHELQDSTRSLVVDDEIGGHPGS